jgi:FMN-dependent oxidoreductase (nitrilotriacetate monooxygenase family)
MTRPNSRRMALIAFLQAQNCSNYPGSWRHPEAAGDFLTAAYYRHIAGILADAKFHMAFFDDRLAMPDIYGRDHRDTVAHGIRAVKLDPIPIATAMALAAPGLGVGATCSTTYFEPFHVARVFATLDHLTGGRAAWNVVTSLNDSEAANFGLERHPEHDLRYDRADEFMEVVFGHWASWEAGALILDRAGDRFADPAKVHRLAHCGRWFASRGPFTLPRTPQGRPVVIQAGQSGRGRQFAARWADLVFVVQRELARAQDSYREFKAAVGALGRDPDQVLVAPACYVIAAPTRAEAEAARERIAALAKPIDALVLLAEALNFDFAAKGMEEPLSDADLAGMSGLQAIRDRVVAASGKRNPTPGDFVRLSGRGTLREMPIFCGTPVEVADEMQAWFEGRACDGFVLAATHIPGAYADFARLVVPELQRRDLFHKEYESETLRGNLGINRPG